VDLRKSPSTSVSLDRKPLPGIKGPGVLGMTPLPSTLPTPLGSTVSLSSMGSSFDVKEERSVSPALASQSKASKKLIAAFGSETKLENDIK
jgi:hypothetical protein